MAIDLTALFTTIGRFGHLLLVAQDGQAALPSAYASLLENAQDAYPDLLAAVASRETAAIRGLTSFFSIPASSCRHVIVRAVSLDQPAAGRTTADALVELRSQMIAQGKTIQACIVSVSATPLSGTPGVTVFTTKRGDGLTQEHIVAEEARLICTADSFSGWRTVGQEQFRFTGQSNAAGRFDFDWPQGSSAATTFAAISADNSLLTNGNFENWSGSPAAASGWTLTVGSWGVDAIQALTPYRGSYSLQLSADSTLTAIEQPITLQPQFSYAVNLWLRTLSGVATSGTLAIELIDQSGTITSDSQGVANSFTIDLTSLTSTWQSQSGIFRLPQVPPSGVSLRMRIAAPLGGANILLDDIALASITAAYPGGPGLAIFSSATPFAAGQGWSVTTANDLGGSSNGATFQHLFYRLFNSPSLLLPSSGSPTLADTLIT